jgi:hypothetical protein
VTPIPVCRAKSSVVRPKTPYTTNCATAKLLILLSELAHVVQVVQLVSIKCVVRVYIYIPSPKRALQGLQGIFHRVSCRFHGQIACSVVGDAHFWERTTGHYPTTSWLRG